MLVFSGEESYLVYDQPTARPTTTAKVVHDEPHISLNRENDIDRSHLYMQGPITAGENYIRCRDQTQETGPNTDGSEDLFHVDSNGNVLCGAIESTTLDSIESDITNLQTASTSQSNLLNAVSEDTAVLADDIQGLQTDVAMIFDGVVEATSESTTGTLVKRGSTTTEFSRVDVGLVNASSMLSQSLVVDSSVPTAPAHINLVGDGIMYWIPQDAQGTNRQAIYRFGHNHEEVGDLNSGGGGLEFKEYGNEVLLQCSQTSANIELTTQKNYPDTPVIRVSPQGSMNHQWILQNDGVIVSEQMTDINDELDELDTRVAIIEDNDEVMAGDSSVWVGSCKMSFQRNNYELRIRYLKDDVVPKYLADQGYTTGNLPTGRTLATMNFIRWLQSARSYTSNPSLTVKDVFPAANLDDDLHPVADFKNTQAVTNAASITGHNTRLTSVEAVDAGTRLTALENAGGGVSSHLYISSVDGSTFQLTDENSFLFSRDGGYSSGTTYTVTMPTLSNVESGRVINFHSLNQETNNAGTVHFDIPVENSGVQPTWRNSSFDLPEATKSDGAKRLSITKMRRKSYIAVFRSEANGDRYWYFKSLSPGYESFLEAAQNSIGGTVGQRLIESTGVASLKIKSYAEALDDKVVLTLERDSSSPSTGGHDHKCDFEMTQHGSLRLRHTLFQNVPSSTLQYELMRWQKFGSILVPGGATSSVVDANQSGNATEPGLHILQGTLQHSGLSGVAKVILKNLPTSAAGLDSNQVYRDSNGFLRIT
jgi:hypothetical protein